MAPTVKPAFPCDIPTDRRRNSGIHAEMPPMAKVRAANPKDAVRKAGFRKRPRKVDLRRVGFTRSLAPRTGSLPHTQYIAAITNPGKARTKKGARHPQWEPIWPP